MAMTISTAASTSPSTVNAIHGAGIQISWRCPSRSAIIQPVWPLLRNVSVAPRAMNGWTATTTPAA
jgi:hypothetical protein